MNGVNGDATGTGPATPESAVPAQPRGLSTLFFTEMWERFSYYGMRAILAYYLYYPPGEGGLGVPQGEALSLVAVYGSAVYMSGVAGGWLADRVLGGQRAVLCGGVLIMFGHISLALPIGLAGVYLGLVLLVLGTGLLKPNVSAVLGTLYHEHDTRRDAGFSIFYMGINLGALFAPLVCGYLGQEVNWHLGFGAAAVGMALGLVQYVAGRRRLGGAATVPPNPLPAEHRGRVVGRAGLVVAAAVVLLLGLWLLGWLTAARVVDLISALSVVLPVIYFVVMSRSRQTTAVERQRLHAYIPLFAAAVLFWMLFEQQATVLAAYADTRVRLELFGFAFPASWFQSVNPVAILVLAPLFATLWLRLGERQPRTPRKFAGGLVGIGLSYVVAMAASRAGGPEDPVSPLWLVAVFAVMTCGELLLSPVGLSVTTKLAPKAFAAQTMGLFFLSNAAGLGIGAQVVKFYTDQTAVAYFSVLGVLAIGAGVLLAVSAPLITRSMHGVT
ncbi:peptide MFS transporter [Goodfellowiella coeruleoviolacea]|uniref:Proton-dependent oligopeptide transporter, POT family n=1 Tax=Goodfellowiella coeruleoviolacea TaxID=334858 RepID=A0AAE3GAD4_9PSEU|nr:peptide MFS transporter [Goodfellowiella coeruleoviolacea]MCP2163815.1 proton-dependent oligopeptide transporter, POT family [Goodfellowiella coeruleoviolacea]